MEKEYVNLINELATNFEKSIPDDEKEKNKLIESFKNYLKFGVNSLKNSKLEFISKDFESICETIKQMAERLCDKDIMLVKQKLLEDANFDKIREISGKVFELAIKKMNKEKINESFDLSSQREEMEKLLEKVEPYNQKIARELVSETLVDMEFLETGNMDVLSLRLYQLKKEQLEKTDDNTER